MHLIFVLERDYTQDEGIDPRDLSAYERVFGRCFDPKSLQVLCGRLKIIPKLIHGGGWLVRKAVGSKPAVVANALEQAQYAGDGYVEIDIDVEVSTMAKHILSLVTPLARSLTLDLVFLLEGQSESELPERLLGGARLHRINLADSRLVSGDAFDRGMPPQPPAARIKGTASPAAMRRRRAA